MTAPDAPTEEIARVPAADDVHAGFAEARAEHDEQAREFPRQVRRIATAAAKRQNRWVPLLAFVISLVVSLGAAALAVDARLDNADLRSTAEQRQRDVDAALARLEEANQELLARGQEPVMPPQTDDPSEAIAAAVLARVIAQMPTVPTAADVADVVVPTVTANVLGPNQRQLTTLVTDYFRANPPQPGPPVSQAAIDDAVARRLAANPPASGPKGDTGDRGPAGADSTVPGLKGDTGDKGDRGDAGPACPDGYSPQQMTVLTTEGAVTGVLCRPT